MPFVTLPHLFEMILWSRGLTEETRLLLRKCDPITTQECFEILFRPSIRTVNLSRLMCKLVVCFGWFEVAKGWGWCGLAMQVGGIRNILPVNTDISN